MDKQYAIEEDPAWASVHRMIDEDATAEGMVDMDVYVA